MVQWKQSDVYRMYSVVDHYHHSIIHSITNNCNANINCNIWFHSVYHLSICVKASMHILSSNFCLFDIHQCVDISPLKLIVAQCMTCWFECYKRKCHDVHKIIHIVAPLAKIHFNSWQKKTSTFIATKTNHFSVGYFLAPKVNAEYWVHENVFVETLFRFFIYSFTCGLRGILSN